MTKYKLELTEKQAALVQDALELYSRIGCGQFGEITHMFPRLAENARTNGFGYKYDAGVKVRQHLSFLLPKDFSQNTYYGIHAPEVDKDTQRAFDIMRVIRHRIAWTRNPEGGIASVAFDDPRDCMVSDEDPLPTMEVTKD